MNNKQAKLRWSCRRGMLELDLLLMPFLENVFPTLSENEQSDFENLLNCTDQDLYDWLVSGISNPTEQTLISIVQRVRSGK